MFDKFHITHCMYILCVLYVLLISNHEHIHSILHVYFFYVSIDIVLFDSTTIYIYIYITYLH